MGIDLLHGWIALLSHRQLDLMEQVIMGDATLYLADARDIRDLQADCVITDPVWPNCPEGLLHGSDGSQDQLLSAVLAGIECRTIVIVLGFDSDPRFLRAVPADMPFIRSQQLPYAMPGYRGRLLGGDEVAYVFGQVPKGNGLIPGRARAVSEPKAVRATGHPCPRADMHMTQLVGWWSPEGGSVIDPFMGTGATGVACVSAGRKFTGIEIDPKFFDISCKRIEQAQAQLRLIA
jgi:hypothetical protein